jgi:transposase
MRSTSRPGSGWPRSMWPRRRGWCAPEWEADREGLDDTRLEGLYRIGIDEVSYRKGHRYLTVVADHDRAGAVVWAGEGMSSATLERFFDALGAERTAQVQAASMDLHGAYAKVTRARAPHARVCADPFHSIQLANAATDEVRRAAWNTTRRAAGVARPGPLARVRQDPAAQLVKNTRWALLKDPASWTDRQRQTITRLRRARHVLFRAWVLKTSCVTCTGSRRAAVPMPTWMPGWPAPAAVASRPCWTCHAPSAATATRSWLLSTEACPIANSKASTPRSG